MTRPFVFNILPGDTDMIMGLRPGLICFLTFFMTVLGAFGINYGASLWHCSTSRAQLNTCGIMETMTYRSGSYTKSDTEDIQITKQSGVKVCASRLAKPHFDAEPQKWQSIKDREIIVFSAFYEWRDLADGPAIRIIGAGLQSDYNEIGSLYCQFWYEDKSSSISVSSVKYDVIYPSTLHPDAWSSHFIICKLPELPQKIPYAVSVTAKPCGAPTNHLMVLNMDGPQQKEGFAICFPTIYNYFQNWTMVVEMSELHRILGATEIIVYDQAVGAITEQTVKKYQEDGKLKLIRWKFPTHLKSNVFAQRGALNDCLYRIMATHKYVAVHDLDEVLAPRMVSKWPELLGKISKPQYGAYLFQHAYFRRNYSIEADPYLITQTSFWRTDEVTPPGKIRCKSMYEVEKAIKLDLHFPYKLVPGAQEYILPPEEGMLHHYRLSPMESFYKHPERYRYIEDRYMEQYKDNLVKAYKESISKIK